MTTVFKSTRVAKYAWETSERSPSTDTAYRREPLPLTRFPAKDRIFGLRDIKKLEASSET